MVVTDRRGAQEQQAVAPPRSPLRGTQSFVAVMTLIWKRPSLTALELLWRWSVGIPLVCAAWWLGSRALGGVSVNWAALQAVTVFKPVEAVRTSRRELAGLWPPLMSVLRWLMPAGLVVWTSAAALGRIAVLRRLDPTLRSRLGLVWILGAMRSVGFLAILLTGAWGTTVAGRYAVTGPVDAGTEPNLVLYAALVVGLTLVLFMAWSVSSWLLDAAPLFVMGEGLGLGESLRAAARASALRSKLIETNLVMGIVRVALLVLAMVFSASPLPFVTVETQGYLNFWWVLVAILYLITSDLFHVVRRASCLALFRALVPGCGDATHSANHAS